MPEHKLAETHIPTPPPIILLKNLKIPDVMVVVIFMTRKKRNRLPENCVLFIIFLYNKNRVFTDFGALYLESSSPGVDII